MKKQEDKVEIMVDGEVIEGVEQCQECGAPLPSCRLENGQLIVECRECGATYVNE